MIAKLVGALAALDPPPTIEELADALWLAERFRSHGSGTGSPVAIEPPGPDPVPRPAGSARPAGTPAPPAETAHTLPSAAQVGLYVATGNATGATLVRSPAVPAIPRSLQLARALRPLRMTAPSPARRYLEEEATARRFAETGVWEPVTRPSPERSLDLALVVDTGSSMLLWHRTTEELKTVLVQLGAFRDLRLWRVNSDDPRLLLRTRTSSSSGGSPSGRRPQELIDPTRRRVILVLSDCVGAAWQDGRFAALLDLWGRTGPVAILQPLPQRLWWRCGAAFEQVTFRAPLARPANDRLSTRPRDGGVDTPSGIAVPVLELEPRWFGPWARMIATGGSGIEGVALFTGSPVAEARPDEQAGGAQPMEQVVRFRAASSPAAFQLACYLAAAPLQLPVMRLVQRAMLPESTPAHLAEVLLGGLLRRADPDSPADPEVAEYEFQDGIRDVLLGGLHRGEALQVLRAVWYVLRDRLGSTLDFPALLGAIRHSPGVLPADQPFAQVAAKVLDHLGGRYAEIAKRLTAGPQEPAREGPGPMLWDGVPPRNPDFTGRDDLLLAIRDKLAGAVTVLLPDRSHGAGGEGKSQLAVEYAFRYAHEYDLVWWIPAEQTTSARSSLAVLAERLEIPLSDDLKSTLENVFQALRRGVPSARWLLIYDNAADPAELLPLLPIAAGPAGEPLSTSLPGGDVLITSRDRRWEGLAATIDVNVFARPESITLLRRRAPRLSAAQADQLAGLVGDLPLAVEQAGAWQAVTGGTVGEYVELFGRRLAELAREELPGNLPPDLAVSLGLTFELLRAESPVAGRLVELWAFFGPEPVSRRLLAFGTPAELPAPLSQVVADDELLRDAMRDINRFALARFDQENMSLQVHRLVRAMLRSRLSAEDRARVRGYVHAILTAATPAEAPEDVTTWEQRAQITPHVLPSEVIDGDSRAARLVALDQAQYLYKAGDFEGNRLLAELAWNRWRDRFGDDDESALDAARILANALRGLGDIRAAADLNEDSLYRMRRRFGPDHLSTLFAANGFGADLRFRGDFKQARELDIDTWGRMRQRYGGDHPDTLLAANSVGIDLRLLGEFHEAYAVDADALRSLRQRPGRADRDVFRATHHLARDLHELGQYGEALRLQRASLEHPHAVLGPDHAIVLQAQMSHAGTLRKSGDIADAERLAAETFDAHVRRFGQEHPNTLAAKRCLAMACTANGDAERGRRLTEEALDGYRRVMGEDHPFVHSCAAGLGVVLRALGDLQTALETDVDTYRALAERQLGPDHYYSLCTSVGLTNDLYLLGEWEAAYENSATTLARFRTGHGPNHPYTLACAHNHRLICQASGLADETTTDPIAALAQILGDGHPDVRAAANGELLECDIEPTPL